MFRGLGLLCRAISVALFLCIFGMTVVMVSLVLTRYLLSYSPSWSEEATRYMMVWLVMLGSAVLVLFDDHIALHIFAQKLGPKQQIGQAILARLFVLLVGVTTAWTGYDFAFSMSDVTAPGSGLPMTVPILAVPVGMTLMAIFAFLLILRDLMVLFGAKITGMPQQSDFMDGSFRPAENED